MAVRYHCVFTSRWIWKDSFEWTLSMIALIYTKNDEFDWKLKSSCLFKIWLKLLSNLKFWVHKYSFTLSLWERIPSNRSLDGQSMESMLNQAVLFLKTFFDWLSWGWGKTRVVLGCAAGKYSVKPPPHLGDRQTIHSHAARFYICFIMSENIINFLLCTMIYLSYVNLTIHLSQFVE